MAQPGRFAFLDEGEALRRLSIDRDTLLAFVAEKRLRAYPGVGKGNFYRAADIEALYTQLHAGEAAPDEAPVAAGGRKLFDPSYKVHVRLTADLKWYELEDEDFQAWVREMTADGYQRQRANITRVIEKLQRLVALMDEASAGWKVLSTPAPAASPPAPAPKKPARKPLQMFGEPAPPSGPAPATDADLDAGAGTGTGENPSAPKPKRKSLPMLGGDANRDG
jgi:hypothetical protein